MKTADRPRLLLDSLVLGIIGGLSAQLFIWMLRLAFRIFLFSLAGYHPPGLHEEGGVLREVIGAHGLWLIPLSTTIGGLLSGALVYGLAPETEGHGTDTVVKALHWTGGAIRARVAPVKMLASAITIGSGGSAGREGPTALIAAGFGSVYAKLLHRSEYERRLVVLMGMSAGLSAIFRSPIGTAIFAVEVLYGGMDFEAGALIYCMLAAIVAYAVNGWFVGWQPLFQVPSHLYAAGLAHYGWYVALGGASGILASLLPEVFYRFRDLFAALPIPAWTKPGVGGLLLGVLALRLPQVLGGGYGWIQEAIDGRLSPGVASHSCGRQDAGAVLYCFLRRVGGDFRPQSVRRRDAGRRLRRPRPRTSGGPGDCWYGGSFCGCGSGPHRDLADGSRDDRRITSFLFPPD